MNPEDAEARAAAKERRRQRDAANKAAAEARKAAANQKLMEAEAPKAEPLAETPAKKRRNRGKRSSATLEEALTATNPVRPSAPEPDFADFRKPDPLASDVIMDATARLLAPRPRAQTPKKPKAPARRPPRRRPSSPRASPGRPTRKRPPPPPSPSTRRSPAGGKTGAPRAAGPAGPPRWCSAPTGRRTPPSSPA